MIYCSPAESCNFPLLLFQTMLTAISMSAIATNGVVPGERMSEGMYSISVSVWHKTLKWLFCVFAAHSWRFVLYDISLARAWVWWSCWDLLLLGHHFCRCHVHSWLYWNSAGTLPWLWNNLSVFVFVCCPALCISVASFTANTSHHDWKAQM